MRVFHSIVVTLAVVLAGCGGDESGKVAPVAEETTDMLVVYAVNYPLAYFAERIGGDLVEVVFPAPVDEDPAFWNPSAEAPMPGLWAISILPATWTPASHYAPLSSPLRWAAVTPWTRRSARGSLRIPNPPANIRKRSTRRVGWSVRCVCPASCNPSEYSSTP